MALALRLAAYLSCTGLPMGLPFPRQGDFPPGHVFPLIWATAAVVALLLAGGAHNMRTNIYYLA